MAPLLRSLLVLDAEWTLSGGAPHLIELAALRVEEGEAVDSFQTLVRPEVAVSERAQELTGLGTDDLADAPGAAEALDAFARWAAGDVWLAHAARADLRALAFEHARHDLAPPPHPVSDGLALARRLLPELPHHDLASLVEELDLEHDPPHRALPDAAAAWQVVEHGLARLGGWGTVTPAALVAAAGPALSISDALPRPPGRQRAHARRLEAARREGGDVELHYHLGEGGPSRLVVRPRLLYQHEKHAYLEAECRASGLWKTYRLDRVQRAVPL